jgi:NDP-sugar pyrophosphorylase family protein
MLPLAVLAGGFATRLGDLSRNTPKCLIEVNGRPFVDWQLDLLIKNGYTNFVFCHLLGLIFAHRLFGGGAEISYYQFAGIDGGVQESKST